MGDPGIQKETDCTTLMVRNLPPQMDQVKAMQWIDSSGFANRYDFFLWFPPKQSTRHCTSYCFINFLGLEDANQFQRELQGYMFSDESSHPDNTTCVVVAE